MKKINSIGASSGISIAKSYVLEHSDLVIKKQISKDKNLEIKKFQDAIKLAEKQILNLKKNALNKLGEEKAQVFDAHMGILKDPSLETRVLELIEKDNLIASYSVQSAADEFRQIFLSMDDEYMRERASDILDVTTRLIKIIENVEIKDLTLIDKEVIIIAKDLSPSETSQLNPKFVKGFITSMGGRTSHSAIMARTLGIPAIVGVGNNLSKIKDSQDIIMDGDNGVIIIEPDSKTINEYNKKILDLIEYKKILQTFKNKSTKSKDGWKTHVASNIGSPADMKEALEVGAEGVGLFRSEFLYMDSDNWPTEEEQFKAYKEVLSSTKEKIVIRTLDIGGDKTLKYYKFPFELNPFLGYRAVRLQLKEKKVLEAQFRALLRASAFGTLAINVPMIATIEEFLDVKKNFQRIEKNLIKEGHKVGKYELGIMVEIPSVVEMIDKFAKYADFFSIGTNDLIQYTFAADRMSELVSYLYQPYHPAILRKIKRVIDGAHEQGKWVAICGETAGEPLLAPVFTGMGLDEFSMSSSSVLKIRKLISEIDSKESKLLTDKVINLETEKQVVNEINKWLKNKKITIQ